MELPGVSLDMFQPCLLFLKYPNSIFHFLLLGAFQVTYPAGNVSTNLIYCRQPTENMSHVWEITLDLCELELVNELPVKFHRQEAWQ